ncbi:integral membrane [Podospora australis]|uniref:Integral membrane n=1 Tax=Podospora australis TaxID=1536484 RepID=A0AAN6WU10_9PEZI|nr:integral membrane [Podospora australis]
MMLLQLRDDAAAPLPTSLAEFHQDYVDHDEGPLLIRSAASLLALATVTVILRLSMRWRSALGLGIDDALIVISLVLLAAFVAMALLGVAHGGVGKHLAVNMVIDRDRLPRTMTYLYASEFCLFALVATIKFSILAMYVRIFPTPTMRKGAYILAAITGIWWIATLFVVAFQCSPVRKVYSPYMEEGTCLNKSKFFLGNAVPHLVEDLLIMALPVMEVWRLQVPRRQKAAIGGVFMLGIFVFVIGCIRLKILVDLVAHQADLTLAIAPAWCWTIAEPAVAIVTASLPTMRSLLRYIFGKTFASHSSNDRYRRNGGRRLGGNEAILTIGGTPRDTDGKDRRRPFSPLKDRDLQDSYPVLETTIEVETGPDRDVEAARTWEEHQKKTERSEDRRTSVKSDEIPLDQITLRREATVEWSKTIPVTGQAI